VRLQHLLAIVHDDHEAEPRVLVDLVADGDLLLDVHEADRSGLLGQIGVL